jgi:energy-coupling factor transport system permease protein
LEIIRFPVNDLTIIVQITMRYLPLVALSAEKIAKAQASRGGDWEQRGFNPIKQATRIIPLIVPIFVNSLKQAETMAIAMESRGFNAAKKRSSYYDLHTNIVDWILIIISISISVLMLLSGYIF